MGTAFTLEEGQWAVKSARTVIKLWITEGRLVKAKPPSRLDIPGGVFVTLNKASDGSLRGCIGYPLPVFNIPEALSRASQGATRDPRFSPLHIDELERIIVEVSLLTEPSEIAVEDPAQYPANVQVGQDGLIASYAGREGLLLPQVASEYNWTPTEFIAQTCFKAGLPTDAWKMPGFILSSFQAEVFTETEPGGEVVRKDLAV